MLILGVDIETGASFDKGVSENFITEIGAAVFDTNYNQPVKMFSTIVDEEGFDVIAPEAEIYTGIPQSMRDKYGIDGKSACEGLREITLGCDYYMAHNGLKFDIPILKQSFERYGVEWVDLVCIDSQHHVPYPDRFKKSLGALANAHLTMNPFPHRALADVLTMFNIIFPPKREEYNLAKIVQYAKEPKYLVKAETSYAKREQAKKAAFFWDPKEGEKGAWLKEMSEQQIKDRENSLPFRMTILRKV